MSPLAPCNKKEGASQNLSDTHIGKIRQVLEI